MTIVKSLYSLGIFDLLSADPRVFATITLVRQTYRVFLLRKMLFVCDNCRLHVGQIVIRDKLIIR